MNTGNFDRIVLDDESVLMISPSTHYHIGVSYDLIQKAANSSLSILNAAGSNQKRFVLSYDFKIPVGFSTCVECPIGYSGVYFKQRKPRKYQSRMVRGMLPTETSFVTMVLERKSPKTYHMITAWVGKPASIELGNISAFEETDNPVEEIRHSADFWTTHALIEERPSGMELLEDIELIAGRIGLTQLDEKSFMAILSKRLPDIDISLHSISCPIDDTIRLVEWLESILNAEYKS